MITQVYSDVKNSTDAADLAEDSSSWRQARRRLVQYVRVLLWLLRDSIWRTRFSAGIVALLGFCGVSCRATAIGLAVYYGRLMEKGSTISKLGFQFEARNSFPLLVIFAVAVLLAFLVAASLTYASQMLGLRMVARYEQRNLERALWLFGRHPTAWPMADESLYTTGYFTLISGDVRMIGRVLRMLLGLIEPTIWLVVAGVYLFLADVPLTLLVLAIVTVASGFLYGVSRTAVKHTRNFESTTPGARNSKRAIVNWSMGMHTPELAERNRIGEVVASRRIVNNLRAFIGRLSVIELSVLLNDILFAVVLFAVIVARGSASIRQQASWGTLFLYLVALRVAMTQLSKTTRLMISITRFYPLFRRYFHFVEFSQDPPPATGLYQPTHTVVLQEPAIVDTRQSILLTSGSCLSLLTHLPLSRYSLADTFDRIGMTDDSQRRKALGSVSFLCRRFGCPPATLRELVGYDPDKTWHDLIGELSGIQLGDSAQQQLVRNLDRRLDETLWNRISGPLRFALALMGICRSKSSWVILEQQGLETMPAQAIDHFLARLKDRVVIIVHAGNWLLPPSRKGYVAVTDQAGPIGLGTVEWACLHQDEIQEQMRARAPEDYPPGAARQEDTDDQTVDADDVDVDGSLD